MSYNLVIGVEAVTTLVLTPAETELASAEKAGQQLIYA